MKIEKAYLYTQNKTSFGAKVHIAGRKDSIPKSVLKEMKSEAKKIGRKKDIIMIYLGKPETEILQSEGEWLTQKSRRIFAKATINNITRESDLSYSVFFNNINVRHAQLALESVNDYLYLLKNNLKHFYSVNKH